MNSNARERYAVPPIRLTELPLARPALAATGIFSFIHHWNDFLYPLIFLHSETWRTLELRYFIRRIGLTGLIGR